MPKGASPLIFGLVTLSCIVTAAIGLADNSLTPSGGISSSVAVPIDSSYKLIFDDEFNGTSVDTSKWNILSSDTMGGGYAKDQFVPENATEAGGFLTLLATHVPASSRPYHVALIFTKQTWTYGYWEARMKMPAHGHGTWPAFWMNHGGNYPEIDIFEWLGNCPHSLWLTYHPANVSELTEGTGLGSMYAGPDYSASFHVYGMWWQPTGINWYIDGALVFNLTQGQKFKGATVDVTNMPLGTILNSAVGGWNGNAVDASTVFPASFVVDYVHIYSNDPASIALTPQPGYGGPGDAIGSSGNH
jgi:beta-glucanase (GH16 family)